MPEIGGLVLVIILIIAAILFLLSLIESLKNNELSKLRSLKLMGAALLMLGLTSFMLANFYTEHVPFNSRQGSAAAFIVFIAITALFYAVYQSKKRKIEDDK